MQRHVLDVILVLLLVAPIHSRGRSSLPGVNLPHSTPVDLSVVGNLPDQTFTATSTATSNVGVVVIGRNEGQRLVRCLESVRGQACIPTTDGRELLLTGELLLERLRVTLPAQPLSKIGVAQTAHEFRHASAKYPNS